MKKISKKVVAVIVACVVVVSTSVAIVASGAAHNKVPGPGLCYYGFSEINRVFIKNVNINFCTSHSNCSTHFKEYSVLYKCSSNNCNATTTSTVTNGPFHVSLEV